MINNLYFFINFKVFLHFFKNGESSACVNLNFSLFLSILKSLKKFITDYRFNEIQGIERLNEDEVHELYAILKNIVESSPDAFENLTPGAQTKVLSILVEPEDDFDAIIEIAQEYLEDVQEYLDNAAAKEFYDNYLDGLDEEKIVEGKDAWEKSSEAVQEKINKLLNDNDVEETYLELLEKATDKLNEKEAEESAKNPQTGDLSPIMMVLFVVSVLGIIATRSKKEWHFC